MYIDLCLLNRPKRSSFRSLLLNFTLNKAFIFFSMVRLCLWKMSAIPGACIKPGLVQRPLCHKVHLPRCEAKRRHLIMTCDIFGTGQTNTLTLCYLLGKTYKPAHSSATLESLKSTRSTKLLACVAAGPRIRKDSPSANYPAESQGHM